MFLKGILEQRIDIASIVRRVETQETHGKLSQNNFCMAETILSALYLLSTLGTVVPI